MPTFSQALKFDRNSQEEIQFPIGEMEATVRSGSCVAGVEITLFVKVPSKDRPIVEPKRQILDKELSGKCQAVVSFFPVFAKNHT